MDRNRFKRLVLVGGCSALSIVFFTTIYTMAPTCHPRQITPIEPQHVNQWTRSNEREVSDPQTRTIIPETTTDIFDIRLPLHNYTDHAVPKYVQGAINRMYIDMMNNGELINDDISLDHEVIPNHFHYIRFNQSNMKFVEMLSLKSVLKFAKPERITIHSNTPIQGKYWDMVKDHPLVNVTKIKPPTDIFGKRIGAIQHASDLVRIQILLKFGGIYLDNDCVVINEFARLRKHHCVVAKSTEERHMGNMVLMGIKGCAFLKLAEELYRLDYDPHLWYYNGGNLPQYAILDQFPGIAFLADEGVQLGMLKVLFASDTKLSFMLKYWKIIHTFYGHKHYNFNNDTTAYDMENIKTTQNGFARVARWILYDHEEPYEEK